MIVEIKNFLRTNGFRHKRDKEDGAIWTNGITSVEVKKSYTGKEQALKSTMALIESAAKEKAVQAADAERKFNSLTDSAKARAPVVALARQLARDGATMGDLIASFNAQCVRKPGAREFVRWNEKEIQELLDAETIILAPEPIIEPRAPRVPELITTPPPSLPVVAVAPPPAPPPVFPIHIEPARPLTLRSTVKGETLYVAGRTKFLLKSGKPPIEIAEILSGEMCAVDSARIESLISGWAESPGRYQKVIDLSEPVLFNTVRRPVKQEPPKPTLPTSTTTAAQQSKLPPIVMQILSDPSTQPEAKIRMILAWANESPQ